MPTGLDTDPVRSRYEPEMVKSVGNGTTFPKNLTTAEQVRGGVAVLADSVATRLRHSGLYAGGVQVTVRDPQFHDRSRQMQLSAPPPDPGADGGGHGPDRPAVENPRLPCGP